MRKLIDHLHRYFYLDVMIVFFLLVSLFIGPFMELAAGNGFIMNPYEQVLKGYWEILKSPSILITDYVYIAGLGATFFNVATILLFNIIMVKLLKVPINGPVFAGIIMISGFSFFGKNIFNTLPIYLGIYLFSLFKRIPYKAFIITTLFSTGLSPLVSYAIFGFGFPLYASIPLGICCGIVAGFIIPAFASHTIIFHGGYNLYNTGFALGVISVCFNGLFRLCGLTVSSVSLYDYSTSIEFYYILPIMCAIAIIISIIKMPSCPKSYLKMMKTTGKLITDYAEDYPNETILFNFGCIGIVLFLICVIFRIPMNGVVFGSILSILGFSGYGLHLRNVLPVWLGAGLMIFMGILIRWDFNLSISTIVCFVFASGLAPVAGKYGIVYGMLAGALHIVITPLMLDFQGGFDLYNNGFSAGFVAALVVVIADKVVDKENTYERKSKNK